MNCKNVDVSVVVTVYNIEKYIRDCLDSVLQQQGVSLECICVDDASTDESYNILKEYEVRDGRVKIIRNEKNVGLASSRNIGFRNARGEYLYNIDGDDYLLPGALKKLYGCAQENNLDLLGFSASPFLDNEKMERFFCGEDEYVRKGSYPDVMNGPELFARLIQNNDRVSSNMVLYFYRRDYFEKNNLYMVEGLRYADDSMFSMYMAAERAMCIPDQLYMRRYRENSTCTSPMKKCYLEGMIVLFLKELQVWQRNNFSSGVNEAIESYFIMRQKNIWSFYNMFRGDNTDTTYLNNHAMAKYFYKYFIEKVPLYKECLSESEIEGIKEANTLILYGAGDIATEVAKVLEYNDIQNYSVAVTAMEIKGERFRGRNIYAIKELTKYRGNAYVLVAVSKKHYDSIMDTLRELGFTNIHWVTLE